MIVWFLLLHYFFKFIYIFVKCYTYKLSQLLIICAQLLGLLYGVAWMFNFCSQKYSIFSHIKFCFYISISNSIFVFPILFFSYSFFIAINILKDTKMYVSITTILKYHFTQTITHQFYTYFQLFNSIPCRITTVVDGGVDLAVADVALFRATKIPSNLTMIMILNKPTRSLRSSGVNLPRLRSLMRKLKLRWEF